MTDTVELSAGDVAPGFSAVDEHGKEHTLQTYLDDGKTVILYFYPKDSTPDARHRPVIFETTWGA